MVKTYRRCSSCGVVLAASQFVLAPAGRSFGAPRRICCPRCTHTALLTAFELVAVPAEHQEGERRPPGRPKGTHHCLICRHPRRAEIEAAVAEGVPYPKIAGQFWVIPELVRGHVRRLADQQAPAEAAGPGDGKRPEPEGNG